MIDDKEMHNMREGTSPEKALVQQFENFVMVKTDIFFISVC